MQDSIVHDNSLLSEALDLLQSSLNLLDLSGAPSHIGAHVDLAIHELHLVIARTSAGSAFSPIARSSRPQ